MITGRPDYALIGKSYLSAFLALDMLDRSRKVFLLDDGRGALGKFYCNYINRMESIFLEQWAREKRFPSSLDRYASIEEVNFYLGRDRVLLGRSPGQNLRELLRRFPSIFGGRQGSEILYRYMGEGDRFDEELLSYMDRLGTMFFRCGDPKKGDFHSLLEIAPKSMIDIFRKVSEAYPSAISDPSGQLFFFSLRSFYQNVLDYRMGDRELFDLLLNILSPNMRLHSVAFEDELVHFFCSKGGMYKATQVRQWAFQGKTLWGMELASYEGLTRPGNLIFFGRPPSGVPFAPRRTGEFYTAVRMALEAPRTLGDGLYVFSDIHSMGTSWPLLLAESSGSNVSFCLPFSCRKKAKVEFFRGIVVDRIGSVMAAHFPAVALDPRGAEFGLCCDIWEAAGGRRALFGEESGLKNTLCFTPSSQGGLMDSMIGIRRRGRHL